MKASELVKELKKQIKYNGDLDVAYPVVGDYDIEKVELVENGRYFRLS